MCRRTCTSGEQTQQPVKRQLELAKNKTLLSDFFPFHEKLHLVKGTKYFFTQETTIFDPIKE